jgi:hypothetical protein
MEGVAAHGTARAAGFAWAVHKHSRLNAWEHQEFLRGRKIWSCKLVCGELERI